MKKRTLYPMPGERWQHYKGGIYEIITLANHSETQEAMVIYKSIPFGSVYARPLTMWQEICETEGGPAPRFALLSESHH
jgi:hypothetical protein